MYDFVLCYLHLWWNFSLTRLNVVCLHIILNRLLFRSFSYQIDIDQVVYQRWQWGDSSFLCHLQAPLQVNNNIHYCLFDCWYHLHETWKRYQITKEQNKMILVFLQVHKLWFDKLNKTKICHKLLLLFGKLHSFRPLTSYLEYMSEEEKEFLGIFWICWLHSCMLCFHYGIPDGLRWQIGYLYCSLGQE